MWKTNASLFKKCLFVQHMNWFPSGSSKWKTEPLKKSQPTPICFAKQKAEHKSNANNKNHYLDQVFRFIINLSTNYNPLPLYRHRKPVIMLFRKSASNQILSGQIGNKIIHLPGGQISDLHRGHTTVVDVILLQPDRYSATAKFSPVWALRSKTAHVT